MKNNNKWKRMGSRILAVCLSVILLLSNQSFDVFAENDSIQMQESQAEEGSEAEVSIEETQENAEEISEFSDTEESKEDTQVSEASGIEETGEFCAGDEEEFSGAASEDEVWSSGEEEIDVALQNADWEIGEGVVRVSGSGTKPLNISIETSVNRSKYTGEKQVVFGYRISSNDQISGNVNIEVTDCGVMSDDASIEIWKVTESSCQKVASQVTVSEGKVSFVTDGLGEYLAVSDVSTVDLSKENVTVTQDFLNGTQQDGTEVNIEFSNSNTKKYRISQSDSKKRCSYGIIFNTSEVYTQERTMILDRINTSGDIEIPAKDHAVKTKLLLRNVNQVHRIYYGTGGNFFDSANENSSLVIDDYSSNGESEGELYIPYKMEYTEELAYVLEKNDNGLGPNWSQAGIGGGRDGEAKCCTGLTIAGGKLRVLVQNRDGATAIGGGGNADAQISITGGNVTAICSSTGAAIGGGIGWVNRGGNADISISGGTVYAENIGAYTRNNITYGGIAIGSGSSMQKQGNTANIRISGGAVTAYSHYGNGIGSGNSYEETAANAIVSISGNSHVTTNALGGGTSQKGRGGSAVITVSDNAIVNCVKYSDITDKWETSTENVLGAFGIGGGNSAGDAKGGSALVTVSGGVLNCNGGNIGGGDAIGTGDGGDASINVSGGTLDCASIGGGNSTSGAPGSVTSDSQSAGVVVTGGTLKTGTIGGGTNNIGQIGFATAEISGGNIQGQFILANTDTNKKCFFHMTGGTIDNKNLGTDGYQKVQSNGGAVYLSDQKGEVKISGGNIQNATAELGGAVYMTNGSFTLSGDATIQNCIAKGNETITAQGGAVYLDNGIVAMDGGCILSSQATQGGAVYLKNGTVTLSNGTIGKEGSANSADEGAGVYVAGGKLTVDGASIMYNTAKNGSGMYLQNGSMEISNGQILHNISSENGAGAYLTGGTLNISGGIITENTATQNGGGVFLNSGDMTLSGGRIYSNSAVNGAGAYLNGGNLIMSGGGDFDSNTASKDGGGAYLAGGALTVESGAFNSNSSSEDGGGAYLAGGTLTINGGAFDRNTATNGGGAYAADGTVRMFGGNITNNTVSGDGGGFYISSDIQPADVVIRSGTISGNKAGNTDTASIQGNGGAIAVVNNSKAGNADHVIIGLRHQHQNLDMSTREFTSFDYNDEIDSREHTHKSCPTIKDNQATGNGGGIYMASSTSILDIYCLLEENNKAVADATGASIMSVGGAVNIGDVGDNGKGNNTVAAAGNILIKSKMLVKGGSVKLYGNTENPGFADQILVDIQENAGSFADYRYTKIVGAVNYKIEYFENFNNSGMFTAIQYEADDKIPSMGAMYKHEGYKIIGWATNENATEPTYKIGETIGSKDDHKAWESLNDDNAALKLYAIWQKISYTVVYNANAQNYIGVMANQSIIYADNTKLSPNSFKVTGKIFTGWNTNADGTGIAYTSDYNECMMTSVDGATVTLYAQWKDCDHSIDSQKNTLTYTKDETNASITETCSCGGHTVTVKLIAVDTYYDGKEHPARLEYTGGNLSSATPIISYKYSESGSESFGEMSANQMKPVENGYYQASITLGTETVSVTYQIKSPTAGRSVEGIAIAGQRFENFNGTNSISICHNDAFTVQFIAHNIDRNLYSELPVLKFTEYLPKGTSIIMQNGGLYWYLNLADLKSEIKLTDFTEMGGNEKFKYESLNQTDGSTETQQYRFIIDFSNVETEYSIDKSIEASLTYKYNSTDGESTNDLSSDKLVININRENNYEVSWNDANELTVKAPQKASGSRFENKSLLLEIKPNGSAKLPADTKLSVVNENETHIYPANINGTYLVPLNWAENQTLQLSLISNLAEGQGKTYAFTANLYIAPGMTGNTQILAKESNSVANENGNISMASDLQPSLKITGTQRVFSRNDILNVAIDTKNVNNCNYTVVIQKKEGDGYSGTFLQGNTVNSSNNSFSLNAITTSGSYRLLITVSKNNQTLLSVPYYFIIK